ncbi:potassium transporter [Halolactibacillus alkaliphilus]|uniref:Potassium transporter n=1 Tax=Halolactibacillus alkaliphilus TaxID=442899 RepID=A0A511X2J8_9BACI|nr:cation:proton antiporter [Halolactibacillus alkaliphilus]GEN57141.1 potassium transporter [Halolactibacillus alkaliphilus]GGN72158.1 potassium transporter [Halolactibacillus alkaliphilus]SFO88176.1 sodium/proton antiporter, CPA1 family (TC 2.A.36) [Halolactibacillus alkaliphilus]
MLESVALLLIAGFTLGMVMKGLKLPPLLGMLFVGMLFGPYVLDWLHVDLLHISSDIRSFSLFVILIRAGLGIKRHEIKAVGSLAVKMSSLPGLFEGFSILLVSYYFFDFSFAEAGMLGFIIAAVSPAVVVPSMLELKSDGYGEDKQIPTLLLAGTSIDDVFAITIFSFFLTLGTTGDVSLTASLLTIPLSIVFGVIFGLAIGYVFIKLFDFKHLFQSNVERLLLLLTGIIGFYAVGEHVGIASLLGIMAIGFLITDQRAKMGAVLANQLLYIWFFAQILLFSLVGAEVNITVALNAGIMGIVIIFIGLVFRSLGVLLATLGSNLNRKERIFCVLSYFPKATVQAAIGALPLASGVSKGPEILAVAVLSILLTAPMGAILIKWSAPKLLTKKES